jgi:hypothetical protein
VVYDLEREGIGRLLGVATSLDPYPSFSLDLAGSLEARRPAARADACRMLSSSKSTGGGVGACGVMYEVSGGVCDFQKADEAWAVTPELAK